MPETTVPRPGLGTWLNVVGNQCRDSVAAALELGYRHVDTAPAYDNEEQVGAGLAAAGVPREEVFLATKVSTQRLEDPYDEVLASARGSLEKLGVASVDVCTSTGRPGRTSPSGRCGRSTNSTPTGSWTTWA